MAENAKRAGAKPAKPSANMFDGNPVQSRPVVDVPTDADIERVLSASTDQPPTDAPAPQPIIETTAEFASPAPVIATQPRSLVVSNDGTNVLSAPDTSPRIVNGNVVCASMRDVMNMARHYIRGGMVPRGLDGRTVVETESRVAIAIEFGINLGLSPLQALQSVMVTNGRPCLWGDAPMALVSQHPAFEGHKCEWENHGTEELCCTFTVYRRVKGRSIPNPWTYGIPDAKRAGLWGKAGPWQTAPKRMLMIRARAFALRDAFPDALRGAGIHEEMDDVTITAADKTAALQSRIESGVTRGVDQNAG
jgi:hypothetical protein